MKTFFTRLLWTAISIILILLSACSTQPPDSASKPPATPTTDATQAVAIMEAKSTQDYLSQDPEVLGYRAVLMLERAADLILAYGEKVEANPELLKDKDSLHSYTAAFIIAVDYSNQTTPPKSTAYSWKQVYKVISMYNQAYTVLDKGNPLAHADIVNLRIANQILVNYQDMAEKNLAQRELGADFLAYQQERVEQYLKEQYQSSGIVPTALVDVKPRCVARC